MALVADTIRALAVRRSAPAVVAGYGGMRLNLLDFLGLSAATGREITERTAFTVTALWRGWSLLASVGASLPLHTYQEGDTGRKQIKLESERYIWGKPNPEVNKFIFWATVLLQYFVHGNAYVYVVAVPDTPRRRPVELWPIDPQRVQVWRDSEGRKQYLIDGTSAEYDWLAGGRIVHLQGLGTDGLRGASPIRMFAQSIGLMVATEEYAARFFGSGSAPGGYLSTDQPLTPTQAQALSEAWEEYHKGIENAHRVAVVGSGTKWMTTALNPEDAQLLMTRNFGVADASRITGVPEHLLGSHDKQSSWGTGIAEQNQGLLTYTLDPHLINLELTISEELLAPANHYAKFSREGLLRGKPAERAEFYTKMQGTGALSTNEIRALEDMEDIGPDGDIRLRPANFVPLDTPAPTDYGPKPGDPVANVAPASAGA